MSARAPVWVDHHHTLIRRGIARCLGQAAYPVAGESAGLDPLPDVRRIGTLVFDVGDGDAVDRVAALTFGTGVVLVGVLGEHARPELHELRRRGVAAVIAHGALTPSILLRTLRAVAGPAETMSVRRRGRMLVAQRGRHPLTDREYDVLRLLADGATTRDIAEHMNYSERTVKSIVSEVLAKLHGRTRAHAVANAVRSGMI